MVVEDERVEKGVDVGGHSPLFSLPFAVGSQRNLQPLADLLSRQFQNLRPEILELLTSKGCFAHWIS